MVQTILLLSLLTFAYGTGVDLIRESGENFPQKFAIDGVQFEVEPLRPDYNQQELDLVRSLNDITLASKSGLFHFPDLHPKCTEGNLTASCCITINALKKQIDCCVEAGFNVTDLDAYVGVSFNHHPIILKNIEVGKLCWGLPAPLSKISVCLWVYHFEVDPKRKEFEFCSVLEITPVFHVGFNCLKFENGTFSTNESVKPEEKGIVNVEIIGGKMKFEIDRDSIGTTVKDWISEEIGGILHIFGR